MDNLGALHARHGSFAGKINRPGKMSISAIITTYQRPALLEETLHSCFAQTRLPDEILIGDDSPDDETEKRVKEQILPRSPVPIHYFHHKPALKEVANVDFLYARA